MADHVEEGREHFDISSWEPYSLAKKDHKLEELIEEVKEGEIPLQSYIWIHGDIIFGADKMIISRAKNAHLL